MVLKVSGFILGDSFILVNIVPYVLQGRALDKHKFRKYSQRMNIIEAVKSGKPIARKGKPSHKGSHNDGFLNVDYLLSCCGNSSRMFRDGCIKLHLTKEDILADDWEVKD